MKITHDCGETYHADVSHIGYFIRCHRCGEVFAIQDQCGERFPAIAKPAPMSQHSSRAFDLDSATREVGPLKCPHCNLLNPPTALRCDCGYGFRLQKDQPIRRRHLVRGWCVVVLSVVLTVVVVSLVIIKAEDQTPRPAEIAFTPSSEPTRPLPNGYTIKRSFPMEGLGELTIDNGTNLDADVKLVGGNRVLSRTYVSAYQQHTVSRIPPGAYRLMFCQGSGWASGSQNIDNGTFVRSRTCF